MKRKVILLIVLFLTLASANFLIIKGFVQPLIYENNELKANNIKLVASNAVLLKQNYLLMFEFYQVSKKQIEEEYEKISQMSWMPYNIFSKSSKQYKLQLTAYTDKNGLRKVGDYYCVALGSYYTDTIGDKFIMTMSTGEKIKIIVADQKADTHTDSNNQYTTSDGSQIEFVVDVSKLNSDVKTMGNVAILKQFRGNIISIEKEI